MKDIGSSSATWLLTDYPQFDDLKSNPIRTTEATRIVNPYDGLKFNIFFARENGLSILRAQSPNNTASSNTLDRTLAGEPPANITTKYPGLQTQYFDFLSTYIGCAVTSEASLGVPQRCTLLFTRTKKFGRKTFTKTCE